MTTIARTASANVDSVGIGTTGSVSQENRDEVDEALHLLLGS